MAQRRAFSTDARDPHPRINRAPPSSSHAPPVKPLVLVHRTTLFSGCIAHHVAHMPHLRCSLQGETI
eukprot:6092758-Prymnesium_polylepis.1